MTKKQLQMLRNWYNSDITSLEQAYCNWSSDKEDAYNYCIGLKEHQGGFAGCIPTHNGWKFTYAFLQERVNQETGVLELWLWYITKEHTVTFYICDRKLDLWDDIRLVIAKA